MDALTSYQPPCYHTRQAIAGSPDAAPSRPISAEISLGVVARCPRQCGQLLSEERIPMTYETPAPTPQSAPSTGIVRGHRGRGFSAKQRAEFAARGHINKLPLEAPTRIEAPTLEQRAIVYNVSVARIQRQLNGE